MALMVEVTHAAFLTVIGIAILFLLDKKVRNPMVVDIFKLGEK